MANEQKTLSQLLEEARRNRPSSVDQQDDFIDIFIAEASDVEEPPDVDTCIESTLEQLSAYHLSEKEQNTLQEMLTFHIQTRKAAPTQPEACIGHYNLLIHGDEPESIRQVTEILKDALRIPSTATLYVTEKELLQRIEAYEQNPRRRATSDLIPLGRRFIVILECQEAPRLNLDGGSAVRDASKKAMERYHTLWQSVFSYLRSNPQTILIVGCSEDAYRITLWPFTELSQRVCRQHIFLKPRSEAELMAECVTKLEASSFSLSEDFVPALENYFSQTYRNSELRAQAFVSDLVAQIYTRYYSQKRQQAVLTADCIPPHDSVTQSVETVLGQLDRLVGLEAVKKEFRNIYTMQVAGLQHSESSYYHMTFSGNPGTGKTTVARLAADLFFRMGVLKTNKLIAVKPSDLISEWIGGTGMKATEIIRRAYNGVLFIDEAYGIANMDRGDELLNVLIQEMENHADKLIVILAGYTDEMRQLLKSNPGLGSRIAQEIHFDDYSQEELVQIFLGMCKKDGFSLDDTARDELEACIGALMTREFFGNARDVRNMLQDLKEVWSEDFYAAVTAHGTDDVQMGKIFLPHHFERIMPPKKEISIHDLIGLDVLKQKLEVFKRQAMYQKHLRTKGFTGLSDFSMHMIFTGNPGTGKSTVAKLIADDLYSIGMLKTNRLVIAERKDLVSARGDTAQKTADLIRKAVGGVLFIDEAYSLAGGRYGNADCIEVLLTAMEEHKADTVFIFAGYVDEMQEFLLSNPGIQSRIGYTFHFEDYTPLELTRMYGEKMKKTGFSVAEDALDRVREIMEYFQDVKHFGNGRFVAHVIHQTISQRANRDFTTDYRSILVQDIPSIKTLIETAPNSMHLYDPATVTPEQQRRTAVHELGHAIVMVGTDPQNVPESISIRSHAGSYGRVKLATNAQSLTEQQLFNHVATLLGGKNAEKLLFGNHSTGCASDYDRARQLSRSMVQHYGMCSYGKNALEILAAADQFSTDILTKHSSAFTPLTDVLLSKKELTGEELVTLLQNEVRQNP